LETEHKSRSGFIQTERLLIIESISVGVIQKMGTPEEPVIIRKRPG
jgi:5-oxoprolinase (ATP-hydrolysing)